MTVSDAYVINPRGCGTAMAFACTLASTTLFLLLSRPFYSLNNPSSLLLDMMPRLFVSSSYTCIIVHFRNLIMYLDIIFALILCRCSESMCQILQNAASRNGSLDESFYPVAIALPSSLLSVFG